MVRRAEDVRLIVIHVLPEVFRRDCMYLPAGHRHPVYREGSLHGAAVTQVRYMEEERVSLPARRDVQIRRMMLHTYPVGAVIPAEQPRD
jgi:hypothetical protein